MNILIASIVTLSVIGCVSAVILYLVAKKFKVEEDPRIDEVESVLPGANCGGCGYPGCRGFADACVKSDNLDGKLCPVGGQPVMAKVADILGMTVEETTPKVAVVRCNGTCSARPRTSNFDGTKSCAITVQLYGGETGCTYGCLGYGDCVEACAFDAIHINPQTGLPEVDEDKCTACGACVKACPKHVIELRNKGLKNRRVYVSCINRDRGAVARKACSAACIGCGKCAKACPFDAITIENNLAYIDFEKCRLCRKCVVECPTGAIHDINFPTPAPAKKSEPATTTTTTTTTTATAATAEATKNAPKPQAEITATCKPTNTEAPTVKETATKKAITAAEERQEQPTPSATTIQPAEEVKPTGESKEKILTKEEKTETAASTESEVHNDEEKPAVSNIIPDDIDAKSLIPEELRVTPREKPKETKAEPTANKEIEMPKLDL